VCAILNKKMMTPKQILLAFACLIISACAFSQTSVRPYTQVFSQNLKGGTTIFGNTSMSIVDNSVVNLTKMNETGLSSNTAGGLGFSNYGNDGENMQPVTIDAASSNTSLFSFGASGWRYYQPSNDATYGTTWRTLVNPATWATGNASFGYGTTVTTSIPTGKPSTYYVKTINIPTPSLYTQFNFTASFADGGVVYINGVEVTRANMPSGSPLYNTLATVSGLVTGSTFSVPSSYFTTGNNVIAVEIHKKVAASSLTYWDMSMTGVTFSPTNSSAADLVLPAGTNTIKFARLYWGGRINNSVVTGAPDTLRKVKIRKGNSGAYIAAFAAADNVDQFAINGSEVTYQSYVDVTSFIQQYGAGSYTVADVPSTPGSVSNGGKYAGWCIMIAYENTAMPYNSIRIYDGYSQVYDGGTSASQTVTLSGLNVPNNELLLADAVMSTMAWEGDANLSASANNPEGDFVKVNGIAVSNAMNPVTNFWNGSVTRNGANVTTKSPNYTNQMGIDIDEVQVGTGYGINPGASSVTFVFGTEADQYFPSIFGFSIRMKDPIITINKTVADASGNNVLESGEVLTYTLTGDNTGKGNAYNTVVVDSLPTNVTYVANSLQIISAPGIPANSVNQTDAADADYALKGNVGTRNYVKFFIGTGATSNAGGTISVNESYTLKLKVKALTIPGSVTNTARVIANSQAGETFTDDATALIGPSGAPLSVTLFYFTAKLQNGNGVLFWETQSELNNDHFEVQRSEDAIHFEKVGIVAGNGSSAVIHDYTFTDPLNNISASVLYYRLKIVNRDGDVIYTSIIPLRLKGTATEFNVYPNPFVSDIKIAFKAASDADYTFRIVSLEGREIVTRKATVQKGENVVVMKDLEAMAAGSYILEISNGTEKVIKKIVKR
jgi:uncharacterized repeat protein (TIGR01451 family)